MSDAYTRTPHEIKARQSGVTREAKLELALWVVRNGGLMSLATTEYGHYNMQIGNAITATGRQPKVFVGDTDWVVLDEMDQWMVLPDESFKHNYSEVPDGLFPCEDANS